MPVLKQIVPTSVPIYAVFAGADGKPEFCVLACVGTLVEENKQLVTGFCIGDHLEPADHKRDFIGYADKTDPAPWADKARERREQLDGDAKAAANGKAIVIPDVEKSGEWRG